MEPNAQTTVFDIVIWAGAAMTVGGLLILLWCILRVMRAKRAKLDDEALRAEIRKVLPINLGALCLSMLGLMLVIVGVMLG